MAFLAIPGCGPSDFDSREDYVIRVADRKVTVRDFIQAFELTKTAYPQSSDGAISELQDARHKLLEEMTIELVMLKRSEELGLSVSEAELEGAVDALKADYPPEVFEETLIESAVSLESWKQRMRARLLMEKLVQTELGDRIVITAEDVAAHYDRHYKGRAVGADSEGEFQRLKEIIVIDLRREKLEEAYGAWISGLKQKYSITVNSELWDRLSKADPTGRDLPEQDAKPGS
jgi:SurA N-terminal domain